MSMNHEHFKEFNWSDFHLGAPIGCRNKNLRPRVHETINEYMYGILLRDNVGSRATSHEWQKEDGHEHPCGIKGPHDLVMLPLFLLDGKPVFVGDEIMDGLGQVIKAEPGWDNTTGLWRWPAPMVATRYTAQELSDIWSLAPGDGFASYVAMANAAIAKAIADGDVILPGLQVSPRKLRDGDCFMDISEPGAPVGNIYGSQAAIDLVRSKFAEKSSDEKISALLKKAAREGWAASDKSMEAIDDVDDSVFNSIVVRVLAGKILAGGK